ncbi:MAG: PAS domain S-box protein [Balneola sp.]|nr:MAG: PAS domain S-box protein [Balneola sp.]
MIEYNPKETNQLLSRMFNSIPVLLIMFNKIDKSVRINDEFERILGWTNVEVSGLPILETFIKDEQERKEAELVASKFDGTWGEFQVSTKSGNKRTQRWARVALNENISVGIGIDLEQQKRIEDTLSKEQKRFELISKSTNDVLYEWDLINDSVWWSRGWETHFGFKPEQIGHNFGWLKTLIHPEDLANLDEYFEKQKNSKRTHWDYQYRIQHPNGDVIHVLDKGYFIRDTKGKAIELVGALVNISDDISQRIALRDSEEKYRILFHESPMPKSIFDPITLKFVEANDAALKLYGYSKDEITSVSMFDIHPPEEMERVIERAKKYHGKPAPTAEWRNITKSGEEIYVEVTTAQISYFGQEYRMATIKDITAQRKAEEKVFSAFVEGENRERIRLAQELHDGIGQYLAATYMNLDSLRNKLETFSNEDFERFDKAISYLKQAMVETRTLSHNLMPKVIEDYGLAIAAKELVNDIESNTEIDVNYFSNIEKEDLSQKKQINIYRIIQECLANIVKHSGATKVSIQLIKDKFDLMLTIEDNGVGFDGSSSDFNSGLGLRSIKTRVFIMGGIFDIETRKEKGTLISVSVPLSN